MPVGLPYVGWSPRPVKNGQPPTSCGTCVPARKVGGFARKIPLIWAGPKTKEQILEKWDPVSKRLVKVKCECVAVPEEPPAPPTPTVLTAYLASGATFSNTGFAVAYGNDRWVAVGGGSGNKILYSDDGRHWIAASGDITNDIARSVAYGDGKWVAVASGGPSVMYSTNGSSWSSATIPAGFQGTAVLYANNRWVATGSNTTSGSTNTIIYSSDGQVWTAGGGSTFIGTGTAIAYGDNTWVAFSESYGGVTVAFSLDNAVTWQTGSGYPVGLNVPSVAYGNGRWVAVGSPQLGFNGIFYSLNGQSWNAVPLGDSALPTGGMHVAHANNLWVAVGSFSIGFAVYTLIYSTDGINWTPASGTTFTSTGNFVTYANGRWIAVGDRILTSINGMVWEVVSGASATITSAAYGENTWACVGSPNIYLT